MCLVSLFFIQYAHGVEFDFVVCAYLQSQNTLCSRIAPWSRDHLLSGNNTDNSTVPSFLIVSHRFVCWACSHIFLVITFFDGKNSQSLQHYSTGNSIHLKPNQCTFCKMSGNTRPTIQDRTVTGIFEFHTFPEHPHHHHSHRGLLTKMQDVHGHNKLPGSVVSPSLLGEIQESPALWYTVPQGTLIFG